MSIIGTGIDIVEIYRISSVLKRQPKFLERVFTFCEVEYFHSKAFNPCHIAGNFAAKEAILKALGTGIRSVKWRDMEIKRDLSGKPNVFLHGNAVIISNNLGIRRIHVSISHGRDYAIAQAVAEGDCLG